jgi:hypothetical protein
MNLKLKNKSLKKEQTKCSNLFVTSFLVGDPPPTPPIPNEDLIIVFLGRKICFHAAIGKNNLFKNIYL